MKSKDERLSEEFKTKEVIHEKDIASLFFAFLNRERFDYTVRDIYIYFRRCLCLRSFEDKKSMGSEFKKHYLFQKAEIKFAQDLDVVNIIKSLRKFKMVT